MKVSRLFSVALASVLVVCAMLASSASAIPKFKLPITKRGFTVSSATSVLRVASENDTVVCASANSAGLILGDDEIDLKVHFLGCFLEEGSSGPCTIKSVGAPGTEGLVLTELLLGLLGLLHEPSGAAGVLFEPKTGHVFTTFAPTASPCNTSTTAVEGSVGAEFSPTGKRQTTAVVGLGSVTLILTLSGVVKPKLSSFGAAASTEELCGSFTFEEAVEVS